MSLVDLLNKIWMKLQDPIKYQHLKEMLKQLIFCKVEGFL
jgi:hypothetical protein